MIAKDRTAQDPSLAGGSVSGPGQEADRLLGRVLEASEPLRDACGINPAAEQAADVRGILRLLAYCYAKGVFASTEIEAALNVDPVLRFLTRGRRHESAELRRFRRRNRQAVQRCLARTLEKSWADPESGVQAALASRGAATPASTNPLPESARPDFEGEAAYRIRKAICDDTALLDE